MRQVKILILIFCISGCSTQKYFLTTNPEMVNSYYTKKIHDGHLLSTSESYHIQNKVILIPKEYASEQVMDNTIHFLQNKKYFQLEKYLATVDKEDIFLPIANGLLMLYRKNYRDAILELKNNKHSELQFIVDLLIVDCEYEITLLSTYDPGYYVFLEKYQNIVDTYKLTDAYKVIINNRIQFIRYKI